MTQAQIKKNYMKAQVKFMKAKTEHERYKAANEMAFWRIRDHAAVARMVR
jgi:CRISPR/Cas system CMR-associated protein Cmr5 small subunit